MSAVRTVLGFATTVVALLTLSCRDRSVTPAVPVVRADAPSSELLVAEQFVSPTCARQPSGAVRCWSDVGPIAIGSGWTAAVPALTGATQLVQGTSGDYVVRADGTVLRWVKTLEPVSLLPRVARLGLVPNVSNIALLADGTLWSWEERRVPSDDGGEGAIATSEPRATALPPAIDMHTEVSTCFVSRDQRVFCARFGEHGELAPLWMPSSDGARRVTTCDGKQITVCAVTDEGLPRCWFAGNAAAPTPVAIPALPAIARIACRHGDEVYFVTKTGGVLHWTQGSTPIAASHLREVRELRFGGAFDCIQRFDNVIACRSGGGDWELGAGRLPSVASDTFDIEMEPLRTTGRAGHPRKKG